MLQILIFFIFVFSITCSTKLDVTEVNSANVDRYLNGEKFALVMFHAPWQKDCQNRIGVLELLQTEFRERDDIFIGMADTYNDRKLATKFHIEDYCLMKYFIKGSLVAENYDGGWTKDALFKFVNHHSVMNLSEDMFKQKLIQLNEETFQRVIKDKTRTAMVLFHASWCKKCTKLLSVMRNIARTFQKEPRCIIAHIDGEKNYNVTRAEHVGVYPTFKFYPRNNKDGDMYLPGKYEEMWTEKNMTKFMSVHCQVKIQEKKAEDKMLGRIEELDVLTRRFIRNENRRESIIRETVLKIQTLKQPAKRYTAHFYVQTMRQILKDGDVFLDDKIEQFDKLQLTSMLPHDDDLVKKKKNILLHFRFHRRDEL